MSLRTSLIGAEHWSRLFPFKIANSLGVFSATKGKLYLRYALTYVKGTT